MTFEEILQQTVAILQSRGRVSYRALQRQFELDDAYLADLKNELLYVYPQVVDDEGRGLVWTRETAEASSPVAVSPIADHVSVRAPHVYTPPHLAEKILTSRSALEGERKQVTVLFADIKGSTELIADLDPEAAQQLLDPALQAMMDAVHRYEGTVNQVLGDGIMALFGAPLAHEDHAVRACYAALAMQETMRSHTEAIRRSHGIEMRIRVGLNSGEVVVRTISNDLHMDYSAVGQTTHLAARMEQLAAPGNILLTLATLRLVEGLVQVETLGPIPIKGIATPLEVFELLGANVVRRRLQAAATRGLSRFVGREAEMMALHQALERAAMGHGQVMAALGEAGVGKSRLVYEFIHASHLQGWRVLESPSVSYGKATAYFPIIELFKRYFHIEVRDDAATVRAKITEQVMRLDASLHETIAPLMWLLDVLPDDSPFREVEPPQQRRRTLDGLERLILRESQVQPVLLVCEDLHWIDTETQALLDHLVESIPTAPLLLLVNYRPEYHHGWDRKSYYTQLRLDPLAPESAEELLHALIGDHPDLVPLKRLLIKRTEGNPFFLEESVRTLAETGTLVRERGAYRLAHALPMIQVPATVQAVLASRIDRLPPEAKLLLQTAAVIGHEVSWRLLQTIAELSEADLHRSLAHLETTGFLYETRLYPEREFTFKHALTHEVAYGSLLQERRRRLHVQIMAAIERLYADRLVEQVDRLAHHAFRGQVWDKALLYLRQAGAKATERSANSAAVAYFEQALEILTHLPESPHTLEQAIDLRLDVRHPLNQLGDTDRIFEHLGEAERLAATLNDQLRLGRISAYLTTYFYAVCNPDRALASGQRALAIATAHRNLPLQVEMHFRLGQVYHQIGEYGKAITVLSRNVELLDGKSDHELGLPYSPSVFSRAWLAWCLAERGDFSEGFSRAEEAVRIAQTLEQPFSVVAAYYGQGLLYLRQGELEQALPLLQQSLSVCRSAQTLIMFPWVASALGAVQTLKGAGTDAVTLLEEAAGLALTRKILCGHTVSLVHLSEAYLRAGRMDEATASARQAVHQAHDYKERGNEASALRLLGDVSMRREPPDVDDAAVRYRQALSLAEELGMRPLQAHCHDSLGTLHATVGQRAQARTALTTAIEMYHDMEMTFWLPETEAKLEQLKS